MLSWAHHSFMLCATNPGTKCNPSGYRYRTFNPTGIGEPLPRSAERAAIVLVTYGRDVSSCHARVSLFLHPLSADLTKSPISMRFSMVSAHRRVNGICCTFVRLSSHLRLRRIFDRIRIACTCCMISHDNMLILAIIWKLLKCRIIEFNFFKWNKLINIVFFVW